MRRMSVDDESQPIDQHTAEQLQARAPSNDAPLNILPPELLVKVLANVYLLIRRAEIPWDNNWTTPYQLVCRRWRDVICSTPQFWQEICVCSRPRWLEFCLTRCAGALATVLVFRPVWPDKIYATLRRHASSIRECHIHSLGALMRGLPSLLVTPMPALETLSIDGVAYYGDDLADIPITHDLVPRLIDLDLRTCTAPLDTAVYTSLRSLRLTSCWWTISYGEFLGLMGKCHALQYLSLDEDVIDSFIDQIANPTIDHLPSMMPVVLPRLTSVKLSGQREVLFHLLATIHAPQARRIELTNCRDDDESGPVISRLLAPNPQLRIPFLSSPHTVSLSCWDEAPFKLCLRCGPRRNGLFSIDYGTPHDEEWPGNANLQHNLLATMDIFSVASVDTLEVEGCLDQVAVETWQRVFQTFSNLRALNLKRRGTLDSLWVGLSRATTSSLERDGALCCPRLSEIAIDGRPNSPYKFSATPTLLEVVRAVLRTRADAGGTRLQKLRLYLQYTDELWSQTSELRDPFVEVVKALVGELDYHDWQT
ncbi:hypothetical protein LXA43DRAFT_1014050 [Ganoderma leucocontextum]|nr:hypothetical protein LXA43DRAFT_1014050 [Ganoderma leucocontextum]